MSVKNISSSMQAPKKAKPASEKPKRSHQKKKPAIIPIPQATSKVTIASLPVGSRFEHEGFLYRRALPVNKTSQIGQKLVKHQFSATFQLGTARHFDPNTLVEPKPK